MDIIGIGIGKLDALRIDGGKVFSVRTAQNAVGSFEEFLTNALYGGGSKDEPDGGIIEVKDDYGNWRIIVVSEAKYQGKDIENIKKGK